jgi:hypothetical protein
MKYQGKEDNFQISAMQLIRSKYPEILAIHVPNGGKRNAIEGAKFKKMGVVAGVPDIMIFNPSGKWIGLAIELKTSGGSIRPTQLLFHGQLTKLGWCVWIAWNLDDVDHILAGYLGNIEHWNNISAAHN